MAKEKGVLNGGITMLVLKLLEEKDMYGYQIIEELGKRSDDTFLLKTGTLYPILHGMENEELVSAYDAKADSGRVRKYYHLTNKGKTRLKERKQEWNTYFQAINKVMNGGAGYAAV